MPLPTNEAQESIARRLAQHRNVAVQGPPGTGKTHTIRNLICHLMANGKRVLVVAQKEDPLRVLRDGLPAEIQPLCLAVLGRSTDQLVQLQLAARELSDRGATLDRRAEQQKVDRLRRQLEEAERDLGLALAGLRAIAEHESATVRHRRRPAVPRRHRRLAAGTGRPRTAASPTRSPRPRRPADRRGVQRTARHRPAYPATDRAQALRRLPTAADLPTAEAIRADRHELATTRRELDRLADAGVLVAEVRAVGQPAVEQLGGQLREALTLLTEREGAWTDRLGTLLQADANWRIRWEDHVAASQQALADLAAAARVIAGHEVTVAEVHLTEPRRLLALLDELRQRFAAGKGVSKLFQGTLARIATECRIDGEVLRSADDVDIVVAYVTRRRLRQALATRWAEWRASLGLPAEVGDEPEYWTGQLLTAAATALDWDRRRWPALLGVVRRLLPRAEHTIDVRRLTALIALLGRATAVFAHDELVAEEHRLDALLQHGMSDADASDLWRLLDHSYQGDLDGWDALLDEVRRLAALRPEAQRLAQLADRLRPVAPDWTAQLEAGAAAALHGTGADCLDRWRWRRAQTWFDQVVGSVDPALLGRRVEPDPGTHPAAHRRTGRGVGLAGGGARPGRPAAGRARRLDHRAAQDRQGDRARTPPRGRRTRSGRWTSAVEAVPVWVMSVDRAIEQFAGGAHFDVVIVDEASQADLFALPVLALAERAVVVGDDQQIGPQLGFVGIGHRPDPQSTWSTCRRPSTSTRSSQPLRPRGAPLARADPAHRALPVRAADHRVLVAALLRRQDQPLRADRPAGIGDPVVAVLRARRASARTCPAYGNVNVAEAEALVDAGRGDRRRPGVRRPQRSA